MAGLSPHITETPIKCPVAPLEFTFFADHCLGKRRYATGGDRLRDASLGGLHQARRRGKTRRTPQERSIRTVTDFAVERIDAAARKLISFDNREVSFDLLVSVPVNMGDGVIERSGMGDELRFVPTDPHTLRAKRHENIFVIGDATDLPSSKAGSVAHFQSELLTENVLRAIEEAPLAAEFDGHANCFIETGCRKAILIDFNYDTEPLPGRFPSPSRPMPLLKPSRLNHLGKLVFRWIYWNMLLKARRSPSSPRR